MAAHRTLSNAPQDLETWPTLPRGRLDQLTPMERACLELVARRCSSKEIAQRLGIAKSSVDTYCDRARSKLDVADRFSAARLLAAEPISTPASPAHRHDLAVRNVRLRGLPSITLFAFGALLLVSALSNLLSALQVLESLKVGR